MALAHMNVLLILSIIFKCLFYQNYSNKRNTDTLTPFNIHCDLYYEVYIKDLTLKQIIFSWKLSFILFLGFENENNNGSVISFDLENQHI